MGFVNLIFYICGESFTVNVLHDFVIVLSRERFQIAIENKNVEPRFLFASHFPSFSIGAYACDANIGILKKHFVLKTWGYRLSGLIVDRIKHWRKHGGAPPEGAAVGQAAAILRKATERRKGGFAGGRGGFGRGGGRGGGGGFGGGGRGGDGFGRGGGGGGGFGAPGQYGPR
uniref:Uncharacterized protein n=1 Tax=Ditylum brightwellii TaxID=49249 RepID=A0A7S4QBX8_9STRA